MREPQTLPERIAASPKATRICAVIFILFGLFIICLAAATMNDTRIAGFIFGGVMCLSGIFLLWFVGARAAEIAIEESRNAEVVEAINGNGGVSPILRSADMTVKCRVFLHIQKGGYDILYRRVKRTNELVVNGMVYDEKTALLEFDHRLLAVLDGHTIEAGFDGDCSYIKFDRKLIEEKRRLI